MINIDAVMILTQCVTAILGALGGSYPTPTLTLFIRDQETQNYRVKAAIGRSDIQSSPSIEKIFPLLKPYVKNFATIKQAGNVFEICPGPVVQDDCTRVYSNKLNRNYGECLIYVQRQKKAIIFPEQTYNGRSMNTFINEVITRNMYPDSIACFRSLQSGRVESLSELPYECTHAIIKDLLYERKVTLIGKYGCNSIKFKPSVSLNADIPLIVDLDFYQIIHKYGVGFHGFTTDGMQILYLYRSGYKLIEGRAIWTAAREGADGTMRIRDAVEHMIPEIGHRIFYLEKKPVHLIYKDCPFI